eukprot:10852337-Alexandrium_andersonii.AAC.1
MARPASPGVRRWGVMLNVRDRRPQSGHPEGDRPAISSPNGRGAQPASLMDRPIGKTVKERPLAGVRRRPPGPLRNRHTRSIVLRGVVCPSESEHLSLLNRPHAGPCLNLPHRLEGTRAFKHKVALAT